MEYSLRFFRLLVVNRAVSVVTELDVAKKNVAAASADAAMRPQRPSYSHLIANRIAHCGILANHRVKVS